MTLRRAASAALALAAAAAQAAFAGAGTTPFEFLSLDANARPVALGGAYTALAADSNALLYNPGGLGFVERDEATFMHDEHFQGVHQEYASFAARQGWGAQLNYLSYGDIPKTTISDPTGAGLGSYGIQDLAVSGGYGRRLAPALSVGGALKYIRESIETVSAQGTALDAGLLYAPAALPGLRLGAAMRNLGPDVKFQVDGEKLPLQLRFGGAFTRSLLGQESTLAVDVLKSRGEAPTVAAGVETVLAGLMPVRLGYDMRNDAGVGLTAGVGWRERSFEFDYAFVSYGDLGDAHRLSATVRWGPVGEPRRAARSAPRRAVRMAAVPPADASSVPDLPLHLQLPYRLNRAAALLDAGKPKEAEGELGAAQPLLARQPDERVAFLDMVGRAALERKDPATALVIFEEAVSASQASGANGPDVAEAHAGAARCLLALQRPQEAEAHVRMGLAAHPSESVRAELEQSLRSAGLTAFSAPAGAL